MRKDAYTDRDDLLEMIANKPPSQQQQDRIDAMAHRRNIPPDDSFYLMLTMLEGYHGMYSAVPDKIEKVGKVLQQNALEAGKVAAKRAIEAETAEGMAHFREVAQNIIEKTASEAAAYAPTAYKFRATAAIAALALTVFWMAYGYGVLHSTKRFYVTDTIENSNYVKSFKIQNVKVQGIDVNQVVYDGKSVLFVPASDNVADATKGWIKSKMSIKNPGLMAIVGGLIGSIATIIYINSHYIMLAGERGINKWLNKKP